MKGRIADIVIPDSIDDLMERWEEDDSENYRLTLLHRRDSSLYCFLSGDLEEVEPDKKIDMGMTLSLAKKTRIKVHYDVTFERKDVEGGYYLVMHQDAPLEYHSKQVIPFRIENELPSAVVDRGLTRRIVNYMTDLSDAKIKALEQFGEENFLRSTIRDSFSKKRKEKRRPLRELGESIKHTISSLFHEENSPSTFMHATDLHIGDRKKEKLFVKQKYLGLIALAIPILAFVPYSLFVETFPQEYRDFYKSKFGQSKEEEHKIVMSEFLMGHPKVTRGVTKMLELFKHGANGISYTGLAAATFLAYKYTWPIISYPMIFGTGTSGLTMATNFIRSRGRDSSGIISSVAERLIYSKLE